MQGIDALPPSMVTPGPQPSYRKQRVTQQEYGSEPKSAEREQPQ